MTEMTVIKGSSLTSATLTRFGSLTALLPLAILPITLITLRDGFPTWIFMWLMAFALYAGCKWLTLTAAMPKRSVNFTASFAYLIAWPGMDANAFLNTTKPIPKPAREEWLYAFGRIFLGLLLAWFMPNIAVLHHPSLAAWSGMVGIILILHFGLFHLLALAWQSAGINAVPLMREPTRSVSLAEFWGRRWNTAFHELVARFTFRPVARRMGVTAATLVVFFLSGLIHELVISLPARGGYGLPTAYFLIQGAGVIFERTALGHRLGLTRGPRGWLFTTLITVTPVAMLFHPPFIQAVILPMLRALGAI